jgi:hypothetical protein
MKGNAMRTVKEIKKDLEELQDWKNREEMADDFFYTNGKEAYYSRTKWQLEQELKQAEQN